MQSRQRNQIILRPARKDQQSQIPPNAVNLQAKFNKEIRNNTVGKVQTKTKNIGISLRKDNHLSSNQSNSNYSKDSTSKRQFENQNLLMAQQSPIYIKLQSSKLLPKNSQKKNFVKTQLTIQFPNQTKIESPRKQQTFGHAANQKQQNDQRNYNRGIKNIGNTCYISCVLQCLHKSRHFQSKLNELKNRIQANPQKYRLSFQLSSFMTQMSNHSYNPKSIKQIVAQKNQLFKKYAQNDALQFFTYLIAVISNQLNTANTTVIYTEINRFSDPKQIHEETIRSDESICKSIIQQTFTGRYKVTYTCSNCQKREVLFEKFNFHYLDIPGESKTSSIYTSHHHNMSLLGFLKESNLKVEKFIGQNAMTCTACQKLSVNGKTIQVYATNHILTIAINRFKDYRKNQAIIKIPPFLQPEQILLNHNDSMYQGKVYKLYAAILHSGGLYGGHYTAVCYNHKTGKWMKYDDQYVNQVTQPDLRNSYMLFYELTERPKGSNQKQQIRN